MHLNVDGCFHALCCALNPVMVLQTERGRSDELHTALCDGETSMSINPHTINKIWTNSAAVVSASTLLTLLESVFLEFMICLFMSC